MFAKFAVSGALATVAVLSLGAAPATATASRVITMTDNQQTGRTVALHPGDTLVFQVTQCDASCGYSWSQTSGPDKRLIQQANTTTTKGAGANHVRTFRYTARDLGSAVAKYGYFGPGRSKAERAITMTFKITR